MHLIPARVIGPARLERCRLTARLLGAAGLVAGTLTAADLADFTTPLFTGAGQCAFCHDPWSAGGTDSAAPLATDWRATMMAHSFKDPLWRAVMEYEANARPGLQSFIEDKCLTCHAPLARSQARAEGTKELAATDAGDSPLAGEGVGCTLCHQITRASLGTQACFSGRYRIGTNRLIFGPYERVLTMPMRRHVEYTPTHGPHTQDSAVCAPCHTLFTPILDDAGRIVGEFPEQTPYLEWQHSGFAPQGTQCQDCHLPRVDEPVKFSSRPPWLEPRAPSWRHQFVGGNAFLLELLARPEDALQPNAEAEQLLAMAEEARNQLRRAARLAVTAEREKDGVTVRVTVENRTGHKFPTGHPFRRAWLHVRLTDALGTILFESGASDRAGRIRTVPTGHAPHYDQVHEPAEVQIYQSVMANAQGQATWSLLDAASYLKDNRIPPKGFARETAACEVAVHGVTDDPNFNAEGSGQDEVIYGIPIRKEAVPRTVEVDLLYQSVPPEAVAHLLRSGDPAAKTFSELFRRAPGAPEVIHCVQLEL